jgi:glucose-1-phosphate thymidylyltransferase
MIFHPIARLADAGIAEILIVTGVDHMGDIVQVLGSGHDLGIDFSYRVQDAAGGIAEALSLARGFVGSDRCVVALGDNIFDDPLAPHIDHYVASGTGAMVLLKDVEHPERFGVAEVQGEQIVAITEKPDDPRSNLAVTGIYMYDRSVFDVVAGLEPSARGELEITDVNNAYRRLGELTFRTMDGWWTDAGTFESLARATELARDLRLSVFDDASSYRPAG